jgi:uncharacterized membrane protein YdfJ with MMPL/SSD domain
LQQEGIISTLLSPFAWLPTPGQQQATVQAATAGSSTAALVQQLRQSLRANGLSPEGFGEGVDNLAHALEAPALRLETLRQEPSLQALVERFWIHSAGKIHGAIFFLATDARYADSTFQALEEGFGALSLPAGVKFDLVTPRLLSNALRASARREIGPSVGLALLAVISVLAFSLRRPLWVLLAVLPLLLASLWLLAVVGATRMSLSVENIAALPLILGIGIDDALHVLHHLRRHPERSLLGVLRESAKAVSLTTLTTVLAFASLAFAGHPALRSLGILTGLGVTFCLLTTLTVIPAAAFLFPRQGDPEPLP